MIVYHLKDSRKLRRPRIMWKSSRPPAPAAIFRHYRKIIRNAREVFGHLSKNLRKSTENGRKFSANRRKRRYWYVFYMFENSWLFVFPLHQGFKINLVCRELLIIYSAKWLCLSCLAPRMHLKHDKNLKNAFRKRYSTNTAVFTSELLYCIQMSLYCIQIATVFPKKISFEVSSRLV